MYKVIVGIDYSMSSPALCIGPAHGDFFDTKIFCFGYKKQEGDLANIRIETKPEFSSPEERFSNFSNWVLSTIKEYTDCNLNDVYVCLEGYAFGSKAGQVFQIGENTGLLKNNLWRNDVDFDVVAPTSLKKFATGKGNSNKELMYEKFLEDVDFDIQKQLAPKAKKIGNPVSDIVDCYYLYKYGIDQVNALQKQTSSTQ